MMFMHRSQLYMSRTTIRSEGCELNLYPDAGCVCLLIIIHLCQQILLCLPAKPNTLSTHMWSDWFSVLSLWFCCWYDHFKYYMLKIFVWKSRRFHFDFKNTTKKKKSFCVGAERFHRKKITTTQGHARCMSMLLTIYT